MRFSQISLLAWEEMERSGLGIKQMKDLMAEAGLKTTSF